MTLTIQKTMFGEDINTTKLIQLSELEDIKYLCKLIDKANEVSIQLLAIDGYINKEEHEDYEV